METFKVICKVTNSNDWKRKDPISKIVTTKKLFGLYKSTKMISEHEYVPGPGKDEICIVYEVYMFDEQTYYKLHGYPYGGYDSRYFIRLDELTESQKEIAEKADLILN